MKTESSNTQSNKGKEGEDILLNIMGQFMRLLLSRRSIGKTTFTHRLVCHTRGSNIGGHVNLDPVVMTLPYGANIDIRDTVKYKEVVSFIKKRADQLDYVLVDTPGQIEIFSWSASGSIITEAFSSTFLPDTFLSNMLYVCGILYKTNLPLALAFNKTDAALHEFHWRNQDAILAACLYIACCQEDKPRTQ
ncbi:hypothetical protein MKX01_027794 [Papaver californicum]|nr:hypothetical protein MKX01_027794 [Papaver californicum]